MDNGSSNRTDTDATALTLIATELSDKRSCILVRRPETLRENM